MKKFCFLIGLSLLSIASMAQTSVSATVEYTLRYNLTDSQYEVYARPTFATTPTSNTVNYNWGSSQVSVVVPASVADLPFNITSKAAGGWTDNSQTFGVLGSDFHGVGSNGLKVVLTNEQETLLFTFVLPGGACLPGLRLFVNGTDPDSSFPGMQGGDFANTMYSANDILGDTNLYVKNYANTGTTCTNCTLTAPTLSK